ncbi:MAG: response regulator [Chloroflexota bacterium]
MTQSPIRLLLVDDHAVVRLGMRTLFERTGRFEIVAEAATVTQAVVEARTQRPDLVIMDLRLPDGTGVEACREIRSEQPDVRVIMLTSYSDEEAVVSSIVAGAAGYLLKETPPRRLIEAVDTVAGGGSLLDPGVTHVILDRLRRSARGGVDDPFPTARLSTQERNILARLAEGKTNRMIATELCLSERTVKTYVSNLLQKLHLSRRAEAAAFAVRQSRDER